MQQRPINYDTDYPVITDWWTKQHWPVIPRVMLSTVGVIVTEGEERLAAGWLYQTDSAISWIEWIVGNPEIDAERRGQALDLLISTLKLKAEQNLKPVLFTSSNHPRLIDRYKKHGFLVTDQSMTNLILNPYSNGGS